MVVIFVVDGAVVVLIVEMFIAFWVIHSINAFLYFSNCLLYSLIYFLYLKFDSPGSCSRFTGGLG